MHKLITLITLYLLISCNGSTIECKKYLPTDIESIVDKTRVDSIPVRVELLANLGFYDEANALCIMEDWNELIKIYIEDTVAPTDLSLMSFEKAIHMLPSETDIVMINETHYNVEHRLFLMNYLELFKNLGFQNLAIEALSSDESNPVFIYNGVNPKIGIYTDEPYFTSLLGYANDLEFNIIRYEPLIADYNLRGNRDSLMAENILKQWTPTKGKLIIYCGWAHLFNEEYWLRNYLHKLNPNLNIFSINQTYFNHSINSKYQESTREILKQISTPSAILRDSNFFTSSYGYDMEIIYPKEPLKSKACFNNLINVKNYVNTLQSGYVYYVYDDKIGYNNICLVNPELVINKLKTNDLNYYIRKGKYNIFKYNTTKNKLILFEKKAFN